MAYFSMHAYPFWPTLIFDLTQMLSASEEQVTCLLSILRYMADDCDDESINIEESVRENFFAYLDGSAQVLVFQNILDHWAKILLPEPQKDKLKSKLMSTFYSWIKLAIPEQIFVTIVSDNPNLMQMIFAEL